MNKKINTVREIRLQYRSRITREAPVITTSEEAYQVLKNYYDPDYLGIREEIIILYLNNANKVLGVYRGFSGGMTATVVDIRLILAVALKGLSTGIIISHNHPSGSLTASEADKKLTHQLKKAGELFGIKVLDHVIVSPQGTFLSFADEGLL
ncbi:JAB domain-containing protein [Adhaeribacter radiodurans]|uniref:JAB domain-containing protein n=1 Tax=Adhaeribacter radiodurans TaxID=2745197 RepID=A0A7L7L7K9_9BACT|nr:JAB domain-containing protein [Adhaeribacter radiodurans]QMU28790.1 JAB domain-containing protein [Adhaeribacter radiodurans]